MKVIGYNRYLLAKCHFFEENYIEAEEILLQNFIEFRVHGTKKAGEKLLKNPDLIATIPNQAAGLHVLAMICEKENRMQDAIDYYILA